MIDEPDDISWDSEPDEDEGPSAADIARAEGRISRHCPACGQELYEDAVICSACGYALSEDGESIWSGRSWWWVVLAVLGIVALIAALLASF